ncbi:MAG: hypothetical protein CM1200mP13_09670 [Candidatus Pelagibacterales bacterium]|nr:MAG: hypothetical protein CM1200mP13_09670 [Pelagibacterales bacterium]
MLLALEMLVNLIYYGHDPKLVHILDGGLKKWKIENKSTDNKNVTIKLLSIM